MPEFFVWSLPSLIRIVEADDEHHAAQVFLEQSVTSSPVRGEIPACYVQPTRGLDAPGMDGEVTGFWVDDGDPPT